MTAGMVRDGQAGERVHSVEAEYLPGRLAAPAPGWTRETDVVVVGSGVAGLTVALRACRRHRVLVVTKDRLDSGSTRWAQGGVAAALDPADSPAEHLADTLTAGAGLCDEGAVEVLVTEGPAAVRELAGLGARFDTDATGRLALGREGGHLRHRVVHAGGDATGAEISRALVAAALAEPRIEIIEHALALDLLRDAEGSAAGVTLHVMGEGERDGVGAVRARAVVLATGGFGQVYAATTSPSVSTGDGLALGLRAGAVATDLEFVQFHPTVAWLGPGARGQQPLITEAVRGEGATLVDVTGASVMAGVHPLGDLAPRDVVAKAITRAMAATGAPHVYLDGTRLGAQTWRHRFPTISAACRARGIDPVTEPIPVLPAAHYCGGGLRTDLAGRTSVSGLYACGEVARTGVHGANRLASNSLLEGLVFGRRIAAELDRALPVPGAPVRPAAGRVCRAGIEGALRTAMTADVQVLRGAAGLAAARDALAGLGAETGTPSLDAWQASNLLTVASALTAAALARTETRGAHWREDHPARDDTRWRGSTDVRLHEGRLQLSYVPMGTAR